jgi:hypothetical protein
VAVVARVRLAVELVAVGDPVRAHHARLAHVDNARVRHVQRDPEADEEHDRERDRHHREHREQRPRRRAPAHADHQHPHEQVRQHRVDERRRPADLAAREADLRDAEPEQHEQVEVQQPERAPRVHERQQEQQAQRDPHVRRVEPAPERALVAARHPPADLMAGPRLGHARVAVAHHHLHALDAAREVAHLPLAAPLRVRDPVEGAAPLALAPDLGVPVRRRQRLARRERVERRRLGLRRRAAQLLGGGRGGRGEDEGRGQRGEGEEAR